MKIAKTQTTKRTHTFNFMEREIGEILAAECRKYLPADMQDAQPEVRYNIDRHGEELNGVELVFALEATSFDPTETQPTAELLARPVETLMLSVRAANCLERENIETIGQLADRTEHEMGKIKNMGKTTLKEIREALASVGLEFTSFDDFHLR